MEIPTTPVPEVKGAVPPTVSPPLLIAFVATLVFGFGYFGLSGNILKNPAAGVDAKLATTEKNTPPPPQTQGIIGDKLFLMGGEDGGFNFLNDVWSSTNATTWNLISPNTTNATKWDHRQFFTSVFFNNKIWVLGGWAQPGYRNDVWSSPDAITWTQSTSTAWSPRSAHVSVVFNNKIWVMGGVDGIGYKNDVWSSSNGTMWTQSTTSAPWSVRVGSAAVVFNNKMWIFGGAQCGFGNNCLLNDVWSSSDGINWIQVTSNAAWSPRSYHGALVFNNKMWIFGGTGGSGVNSQMNDVWSSTNGITWNLETANANFSARTEFGSTVFNNNILLAGGFKGTNPVIIDDVWNSTVGNVWAQLASNLLWNGRHGHILISAPHSFGLPDLQITSVTPDPTSFHTSFTSANFPYIIYDFVVKNNGLVPAIIPVTTKFSLYKLTGPGFIGLAGQYSPSAPVTIQPNQTYTFHAKSRGDIGLRSVTGTSTYKLVADDTNIIDESDETNNIFSPISITIIP